jgi:hypothetical protein
MCDAARRLMKATEGKRSFRVDTGKMKRCQEPKAYLFLTPLMPSMGTSAQIWSIVRFGVVRRTPGDFVKDSFESCPPLSMGHAQVVGLPLDVLPKTGMPGPVL